MTESKHEKFNVSQDENIARLGGCLEGEFEYSYSYEEIAFYEAVVKSPRLSGTEDRIKIVVRQEVLWQHSLQDGAEGKWITVDGEFRSRNYLGEDDKSHVDLYLFARELKVCETAEEMEEARALNCITLNGTIGKEPIYRKTPLGKKITEVMLAVNRGYYGKADYIPCIAWGSVAEWIRDNKEVKERIAITGRMQSRTYVKRYEDKPGEEFNKETTEVSIMELVE